MAERCRKRFQGRSLVSFLLVLSFAWMTFSGLVLYIGPPGGQARRAGWTYASLGRDDWMAQHLSSSAVFLVAALVHIYLNRRPLWAYVRTKTRAGLNRGWELLLAAAVTAFLIVGTMYNLPPWRWVMAGSRHLTNYRAEEAQLRQSGGAGRGEHGGDGSGSGKGTGGGKGFRGGRE